MYIVRVILETVRDELMKTLLLQSILTGSDIRPIE